MIEKTFSLIMLTWIGENVVAINLKLFHLFLKIVKIEFRMKLQSFFLLGAFPSAHKT